MKPASLCLRKITEKELSVSLFASFNRYQEVTRCRRKEDGKWILRDIAFTEQWDDKDYAYVSITPSTKGALSATPLRTAHLSDSPRSKISRLAAAGSICSFLPCMFHTDCAVWALAECSLQWPRRWQRKEERKSSISPPFPPRNHRHSIARRAAVKRRNTTGRSMKRSPATASLNICCKNQRKTGKTPSSVGFYPMDLILSEA